MIITLTLMLSIDITNNQLAKNTIIKDMSVGMSITDVEIQNKDTQKINLGKTEKLIDKYSDFKITIENKELIKQKINDDLTALSSEEAKRLTEQIYGKLVKLQFIKLDYLFIVLMGIVSFYFLDMLLFIKRSLISLSRDFEIFNLYVAATIYTNIYVSHREVLKALKGHSKYHQYLFDEIIFGISNGKEDAYKESLEKARNSDVFHLLNKLNIQYVTGYKSNFESVAEYKRKALQATFNRRRTTKTVFAMIPVGMILLLSAIYFSMAFQQFMDINNIVQMGGN
ncbi:MAG: hypothetical protein Q8N88_02725 [Nanoarchaeota archaeon]|nr:hypothetical protein [Nanoarchaeota archaeon]